MLLVRNIKENIDIEYCAFLDEESSTFNLVSTINNEEGFNCNRQVVLNTFC